MTLLRNVTVVTLNERREIVSNAAIKIDETNTTTTVTADDFDTTSGIGYSTPTSYA